MDESQTVRVSVEEAARLLGIEKQSVKKRVQRGKLRSERDASGTLYVWVDRSETVRAGSEAGPETVRDELLGAKDETITILRDQLREEREARRRADTIIAQLTQATSNLTDRLRELESGAAPAQSPEAPKSRHESREAGAEGAADTGAGVAAAPAPGATGAQTASEEPRRRSWWREFFGFGE